MIHKKVGDYVKKGEALATIYANDEEKAKISEERYINACSISPTKVEKPTLIKNIIRL